LSLADRNWPLLRRAMGGPTPGYRGRPGVIGRPFSGAPPGLLVDHPGGSAGENLILVASKGGYPKNPAWFHNLRANPDTTVQVGSQRRRVRARVAEGEERDRLWQLMVGVYGGYESYRQRTEREIPLVVLEPR